MTDKEGKFYYLIVSIILALIFEPVIGLACLVWVSVFVWLSEDKYLLFLFPFWYWFGVVPSIFIAMFIVDLFK